MSSCWEYMPPEDTLITREGAEAFSSGDSRSISTCGPSTWVAKVSSTPSAVSVRSGGITPALLTSTSRRSSAARKRPVKRRTDARSLTSQVTPLTCPPVSAASTRASVVLRSRSRVSTRTSAPSSASPAAAARPRPEEAPVTSTTLPSMRGGSAGQVPSRRRTSSPRRLYPGATVRSRALSIRRSITRRIRPSVPDALT